MSFIISQPPILNFSLKTISSDFLKYQVKFIKSIPLSYQNSKLKIRNESNKFYFDSLLGKEIYQLQNFK